MRLRVGNDRIAQTRNDVIARIEAMSEHDCLGQVQNFAACLYFEDGSNVKFVAGKSAEEQTSARGSSVARGRFGL